MRGGVLWPVKNLWSREDVEVDDVAVLLPLGRLEGGLGLAG